MNWFKKTFGKRQWKTVFFKEYKVDKWDDTGTRYVGCKSNGFFTN